MERKNVLLAIRPEYKDKIIESINEVANIEDYRTWAPELSKNIQIAFVDEDFSGPKAGWKVAEHIRRTLLPIKIVMIVHTTPKNNDLNPLYDILMYFSSITAEELVGEIRRKWPMN